MKNLKCISRRQMAGGYARPKNYIASVYITKPTQRALQTRADVTIVKLNIHITTPVSFLKAFVTMGRERVRTLDQPGCGHN